MSCQREISQEEKTDDFTTIQSQIDHQQSKPIKKDILSKNNPQVSLVQSLNRDQIQKQINIKQYSQQLSQQLVAIRDQNQYLRKINAQANQRIIQLQNLDLLYQRQASLLNSEIQRLCSQNSHLSQSLASIKQYQRQLGIRFDNNSHQLVSCKQHYEQQIQKYKQQCKTLEHKVLFQGQRRQKQKEKMEQENKKLLHKIKELQSNSSTPSEEHKNNENSQLKDMNMKLKQKILQLKQRSKQDQKQWLQCTQQWNSQRGKYQQEIQQLMDSNQTLRNSITQLVRKYSQLQDNLKDDETIKIDKNLLQLQVDELKRQVETYYEQLVKSQQKIQELQKKIDELQQQNEYIDNQFENQQRLSEINQSQELITEIDLIQKQICQLKEQFIKLTPARQQNYQQSKNDINMTKIQNELGNLVNNPTVKRLLFALEQNQSKIQQLTQQIQNNTKTEEHAQIYKQMQNLIEDVVNELHQQKRSRRILEQTMVHLQSQINSYRNSSYQQLHSVPSRLSLLPYHKTKNYDEMSEMTFKKNNSFQIRRTQSTKLLGKKQMRRLKTNQGQESYASLYLPQTRCLKDILSSYVSKQAILRIMFRITQQIISLIEHQDVNITSDKIMISGYQSLSPEKIDVVIQNLPQPNFLYMSPQVLSGQHSSQKSASWSLGILFDQIIHKKPFFTCHQQILNPKSKYAFKSFTFRQLKQLISGCLQKDIKQRPTLLQILNTLKEIQLGTY